MGSGINNIQPILTIAIPTWNRASTLEKALEVLLPQVIPFKGIIEVVISDNASDDNTNRIIENEIIKNQGLNIVYNRNSENLQFFGNFRKCRELAKGQYLWILSDDDFIKENLISEVILQLNDLHKYACFYLKNNPKAEQFKSFIVNKEELIGKENYSLGLISAVIFLNNKQNDELLFYTYYKSPFIGFIFLLNSFNYNNTAMIIEGKCLIGANVKPIGYNFFDTFINGMKDVVDYLNKLNFPKKVIKRFRIQYLLNFIRPIYLVYKAEGKLKFTNTDLSPIVKINKWISNQNSDLRSYWFYFYPITIIPNFVLLTGLKFRRKIKRIILWF